MSQLIIIDVQKSFFQSEKLDEEILNYSKNFDSVIYIYDTTYCSKLEQYDMWGSMNKSFIEGDFTPVIIEKQYDFFRDLLDDERYSHDFIIKLIKLLITNNLDNGQELLLEENGLQSELNELCDRYNQKTPDFYLQHDTFYLPRDLLVQIKKLVSSNCVVVGGGLDSCLLEVSILLQSLDIEHTINKEFCY